MTVRDLHAFSAAYAGGQVAADMDSNGVINTLDLGRFMVLYGQGGRG